MPIPRPENIEESHFDDCDESWCVLGVEKDRAEKGGETQCLQDTHCR